MAFENRNRDGERLHLVVQPVLPYENLVSKHIEFHRIEQSLRTFVLEHIIERIHIFHSVGDRECAALVLPVRIECRRGCLFAVLVLKQEEDAGSRCPGYACADAGGCGDV